MPKYYNVSFRMGTAQLHLQASENQGQSSCLLGLFQQHQCHAAVAEQYLKIRGNSLGNTYMVKLFKLRQAPATHFFPRSHSQERCYWELQVTFTDHAPTGFVSRRTVTFSGESTFLQSSPAVQSFLPLSY